VQLLDVSTTHGPELHLDVAAQEEPLLLLNVPIIQRHVLHLNLSAKQRLAPEGVGTTGACAGLDQWTCLYQRNRSCTWTCLDFWVFDVPGRVYTTGARDAPGLVRAKVACADPGRVQSC
jgi:hypothetical protein